MLVLSRHVDERIYLNLGDTVITLTVVQIDLKRGKVRIGIDAPREVGIDRPDRRHHSEKGVITRKRS